MLSKTEIRERLAAAALAALDRDDDRLAPVATWLEGLAARDLLRVDQASRDHRHGGSTALGPHSRWTADVLGSPVAAALATLHGNGFVRERAVLALAATDSVLADRMLAVRADDHVEGVRVPALRLLVARSSLERAREVLAVLHRFQDRQRGGSAHADYLDELVRRQGPAEVWAALRDATDRDLRRAAFRHSLATGLLTPLDAAAQLPRERDQLVRRLLGRAVADGADPATVRTVLLRAGAAESRALALVRLDASELDDADVEPMLLDTSVLVRLHARRHWHDRGHEAVATYRAVTTGPGAPALRARAYLALTETGSVVAREEVLDLVRGEQPDLRRAGLRLLADQVQPDDVPGLVALVGSDDPSFARLALRALAAHPHAWSLDLLDDLRADPDPRVRARAWRLHRGRGGWEAVIADLEARADPDPDVARLGVPSAPMYFAPSPAQRERVERLLRASDLPRDHQLGIALAAGLRDLLVELRDEPRWRPHEDGVRPGVGPTPDEPAGRTAWWRRLLRNRPEQSRGRLTP